MCVVEWTCGVMVFVSEWTYGGTVCVGIEKMEVLCVLVN